MWGIMKRINSLQTNPTPSCSFHVGGSSVSIYFNEDDLQMINDLHAFFQYSSFSPARNAEWTINVINESTIDCFPNVIYEEIKLELGETGKKAKTNELTLIQSDVTKGTIIVDASKKTVKIYNADVKFRFIDVYRVVRQLLARQLLEKFIPFHGSAVQLGGTNVAFLGDKGYGKSTLVTGLLYKYPTSSYICNDRFFLKVSPDERPQIVHWPECPALTYSTLQLYEELPGRIEYMKNHPGEFIPSDRFIDHPKLPGKHDILSNPSNKEKVIFTNLEFSNLLGRTIKPDASLDYIIFLTKSETDDCKLISLSENESVELLNKNIDDFNSFPDWLNVNGKRDYNIDSSSVPLFPKCYLWHRTFNLEQDLAFIKEKMQKI